MSDERGSAAAQPGLTEVKRGTSASVDDVASVIADGWLYPSWVVGASRMRAVDAAWPAEGSQLHHSFGVWPALISDTSEVLLDDLPRRFRLRARGWPLGEATVDIRIEARGSGAGSMLTIVEDAVTGPAKVVPRPVRQAVIAWRNAETLRRLAFLAEGRPGGSAPTGTEKAGS